MVCILQGRSGCREGSEEEEAVTVCAARGHTRSDFVAAPGFERGCSVTRFFLFRRFLN